jgi:hypothetical protein
MPISFHIAGCQLLLATVVQRFVCWLNPKQPSTCWGGLANLIFRTLGSSFLLATGIPKEYNINPFLLNRLDADFTVFEIIYVL